MSEVLKVFSRIAIANRGEAAMRLVHAVRDINAAGDGRIETVALHTANEARAMFVREADLSYDLGPAAARPYLDLAVLERALTETGADAVWPGWGFMAEDPTFVDLCERLGIAFIGPSAEAMRRLGDKIGSKLLAEEVGVPVAPWSRGAVDTLESALASADEVGYPLMLKATAGGGGRGIRMVASADDLEDAFQRTSDEALRAFGNGTVFLERLVTGARHVEVQLIADGHGTAWALGVRDCSIQRRNQKVIEESASPLLVPEQAEEVKASAERLALAVGYVGAGTVEFLYSPGDRSFAFLEVNTRLQVEHSITEATTDVDLVKAQIFVAGGGRLTDLYAAKPGESGHAVEARLNAEDPDRDFAPAPGRIVRLELPAGPGVRVDTGVAEGDTIPPDFDSMIAKIIAVGRTREEALARLRRAMGETTVVIEGGACNKSFVLDLLAQPEVVDGSGGWADTGWIDRVRAEGRLVAHAHAGVAIVAAAIEAYADEVELEVTRLLETAHGGRPQAQHRAGRPVEVKLRGTAYQVSTLSTGPSRYQVTVAAGGGGTTTVEAELDRLDEFHRRLVVGGQRHHVVTSTHGPTTLVEVDGVAHRVTRDEGGVQRSPAPALVVATPVGVGDLVEAGAPVIVLESMKMETVLHAPFPARVKELLVTTGSQVETGTPLVRLEQVGDEDPAAEATSAGPSIELPQPSEGRPPAERLSRARSDLTAVVLGFDVPPAAQDDALSRYLAVREEVRAAGESVLEDELELLGTFADLAELSRNQPADEERHTELRVHSSREHFHTYLQSLDVERGGLPGHFSDRLARVLRHYGVLDLERTPQLEEAVFRIFLAQQRSAPEVTIATALLGCWIAEPAPTGDLATRSRRLLERLGRATQLRFPVIGDLARSVRFRWFDQPQVDAERTDVLAGVRDELTTLAADGGLTDRTERIEALALIPEQIVRFLAERMADGLPEREPMLEVLARRHYREYDLHDLRSIDGVDGVDGGGRPRVVADYTLDERPTRLVSTIGTYAELADPHGELASAISAHVAGRDEGHDAVVDLYLHWPDAPDDADETSRDLGPLVAALPFSHDVRRSPSPCAPVPGVRSATTRSVLMVPAALAGWSRTPSPVACIRWSVGG